MSVPWNFNSILDQVAQQTLLITTSWRSEAAKLTCFCIEGRMVSLLFEPGERGQQTALSVPNLQIQKMTLLRLEFFNQTYASSESFPRR